MIAAFLAARYNRKLLKELKSSKARPLLVFSSGSLLYGSSDNTFSEDSPINPISYARQYYRGELPLIRASESHEYPVLLFRLPWLLGPGSWFKWFYLQPAEKYQAIPLFGDGSNMMEIIDMRDAAQLMLFYATKGLKGVCNICPEHAITQADFAKKVSGIYDVKIRKFAEVFSGKPERESIEAFMSNIRLESKHRDEIKDFHYTPLLESLKEIRQGRWGVH
jgi:nucleoside-diphosphate-sugar epimerase